MRSARTCPVNLSRALALRELRRLRGLSQTTLAGRLHVSQPSIAKLECQDDMYLSSLRRYVAALGGELELRIRFPDENLEVTTPSHSSLGCGEKSMPTESAYPDNELPHISRGAALAHGCCCGFRQPPRLAPVLPFQVAEPAQPAPDEGKSAPNLRVVISP